MTARGVERFTRALAGARVQSPVRGITFVDPGLLPGPSGGPADPARRLASVCGQLALDFAFVVWDRPWARDAAAALGEAGVAALAVVDGIVWPTLEHLGVETALRAAAHGPQPLIAEMDDSLERSLDAAADALATPGVAGLVVADDMAGAAGPLLDPAFLAREAFPRLARLSGLARRSAMPAILHCDGDIRVLLPAVAAGGFAALHGDLGGAGRLDDVLAAARRAGLAVAGGIATSALADPASAALAGALAATAALGGSLLVADDGGVSTLGEAAALVSALAAAAH